MVASRVTGCPSGAPVSTSPDDRGLPTPLNYPSLITATPWPSKQTRGGMGAMAVTRTKVEEFRRLAQECRARAEMLAMADVCNPVAAQPTHDNDLSEAARALARNQQIFGQKALESR